MDALTQEIESAFKSLYDDNPRVKELLELLHSKNADYTHAQDFAEEVGQILAKVLNDKMPLGSTFENSVIKEIFERTLGRNYDLVSGFTMRVQYNINEALGLNFKVQVPKLNKSRIDGLIKKVVENENFDEVKWVTQEPVITFTKSVVYDTMEDNAKFYHEAGLKAVVVRTQVVPCCKWCGEMAGRYTYPNVPQAVYRRHDRCKCVVEFFPHNGQGQTIHSGGGLRSYVKNNKGVYVQG